MNNLNFCDTNKWLKILLIKNNNINIKDLIDKMLVNKISVRPIWYPNHLQAPYKKNQSYKITNTMKLLKKSICLPSSASFTAVYGKQGNKLIDEDSYTLPKNYYGLTKLIGENLLKNFRLFNLNIKQFTVIRFPSVFGKKHKGGIIDILFNLANKNKNILLFNNGLTIRNIIYIDNVMVVLLVLNTQKHFK